MAAAPFELIVYGKDLSYKGTIGAPISVSATPRHGALPTLDLLVRADDPRAADLLAPGARVIARYLDEHLVGGMVRRRSGRGPATDATFALGVDDDWRLLTRVLAWPKPAAALTAQDVAYDTRTGPAETVIKGVVAANAARLGLPVTVAPNLGRGATVTWSWRFHPLLDRMALDAAGIGITVRQVDDELVVDCYEPAVVDQVLDEASGVVDSWEWTQSTPAATRAVAGNQGEGAARSFRQLVDASRESLYGDVVEVFVDARDTDDNATTDQRLAEVLLDGGPLAGLKVTLSETAHFAYGKAARVGDQVTLETVPGVQITDVLREATLSWTTDDGLVVTPVVGELKTPDTVAARALAAVARAVRNLNRT